MTPLRHGAIALIRVYQWILSPVLPMSCRFEPSCSHYACEAIARHGALYGAGLALWRILRCNPWGGWGYDPVPEKTNETCCAEHGESGRAFTAGSGRETEGA